MSIFPTPNNLNMIAWRGQLDLEFLGISTPGGNLSPAERSSLLEALKGSEGLFSPQTGELMDSLTALAERLDRDSFDSLASSSRASSSPASKWNGAYRTIEDAGDLGIGGRGPLVRDHQQKLADLGYDLGQHGVDGFWGPDTQAAHQAYLRDKGALEGSAPTPRRRPEGGHVDAQIAANRAEMKDDDAARMRPHEVDSRADARRALALEDASRTEYLEGSPAQIADRLATAIREDDTDGVTAIMTNLRNEDMADVRQHIAAMDDGDTLSERLSDMSLPARPLDTVRDGGNTTHNAYRDLMGEYAKGTRREGADAAAGAGLAGEHARALLAARDKMSWFRDTDTDTVNRIFSESSGAQLAALDEALRQGVDFNGETVRYENGLEEYIQEQADAGGFLGLAGSNVEEGTPYFEALMAALDRPLR